VAGDQALLEVVVRQPRTPDQLAEVKGMNPGLARQEGDELLERLARVAELPEAQVTGYPRRPRTGPGRAPPEVDERAERLKQVRNRRADELKIDRGTMLPNAVLMEVARVEPRTAPELAAIPGMRKWQAEVLGEALIATLTRKGAAR
jgi:ribonuclease D